MWYMIRNLRCTVTTDSVLANSKTQNAFLFTVNAIFLHDYPIAVEPGSTPRPLVQKKTWRDSLPIDMLLSSVSVLVVAQSSSEIPVGLMNNPVSTQREGHDTFAQPRLLPTRHSKKKLSKAACHNHNCQFSTQFMQSRSHEIVVDFRKQPATTAARR